jgi:hypothetical protein
VDNLLNGIGANAELNSKRDVSNARGGFESADFPHFDPIQFGMVALAGRMIAATFSFFVIHVALRGIEKKVRGIYATWVVAVMQYPKWVWWRAIVNHPRGTGGVNPTVVSSSLAHAAVRALGGLHRPQPTRSKFWAVWRDWSIFINAPPKALLERSGESLRKSGMLLKFHCRNQLFGYGHAPGHFNGAGALFIQ